MRKILFVSALALVLLQCSKSEKGGGGIPGAGLPDLTTEQKATLRAYNSAVDTLSAVKAAKLGDNSNQQNWSGAGLSDSTTKSLDQTQQELIDKLNSAEANNFCNTIVSAPNSNDAFDIPNASISITGIDCPVNYQMSMNTKLLGQTSNSASIQMAISEKFVLNDLSNVKPDLNWNIDVTEYASNLTFNMAAGGNEKGINMNMTGSGKMNAKSLSAGNVETTFAATMAMRMNTDSSGQLANMNANISITIAQQFADFGATGYMTGSMSSALSSNGSDPVGTGKFYINGKEVTESEFEELFGSATSALPMN
jgi:hypothetical protein